MKRLISIEQNESVQPLGAVGSMQPQHVFALPWSKLQARWGVTEGQPTSLLHAIRLRSSFAFRGRVLNRRLTLRCDSWSVGTLRDIDPRFCPTPNKTFEQNAIPLKNLHALTLNSVKRLSLLR